jgi:hypothetical protein
MTRSTNAFCQGALGAARREDKGGLLDEFCRTTGYHRFSPREGWSSARTGGPEMTIEEVLVQAARRDFGAVLDRHEAAVVEAATLEGYWATLRGLSIGQWPPDEVIGLISSIDTVLAAVETRHGLGTWCRGQRIELRGQATRLLGEEGRLVIPTQWTPL